ncbi:TetR/AcrR family transcriptional regulator [Rhodococcus qingshengii]|uniref:TetR/AcrR family transcriptional regulator n=1 Tax=Rhodococcus qingshengii TaxID=334542 RepID=UPI001AEA98ED|nr:TetR/AcrR family transcriptional regulator [Rhodococcus qingshengii]MBP1054173.1 TetR/AcrR family transcriptional regulator [Rhodococcus qingshengii]
MNSPIDPARTPESAATTTTRPRIGRVSGSKNSAMQDRAVRTREAILTDAAQHFDVDGYGNTSINTILAASHFAKGAFYYHFPSKEAIAQQLIGDWNLAVDEAIDDTTVDAAGETAFDRLAAIFSFLARKIADDVTLRAGMKLTLEASIDNGAAFARWVDAVSDIVEPAITAGECVDGPIAHRLAWNLCSGTVGAVQAAATLREDVDVATRVQDVVSAHLKSLTGP